METKIYRVAFLLLFFTVLGYSIFWNLVPGADKKYVTSNIPTKLQDQVFHWRYENGWDFRVHMTQDALYWQGMGGDFEGMSMSVQPHFREIRKNLYFITWVIPYSGFDSLVVDLDEGKVFAHSKANAKFLSLSGEIYCNGLEQKCISPDVE